MFLFVFCGIFELLNREEGWFDSLNLKSLFILGNVFWVIIVIFWNKSWGFIWVVLLLIVKVCLVCMVMVLFFFLKEKVVVLFLDNEEIILDLILLYLLIFIFFFVVIFVLIFWSWLIFLLKGFCFVIWFISINRFLWFFFCLFFEVFLCCLFVL